MEEIIQLINSFIILVAFYIQGQAYFKPQIYAQAIQSGLISALSFYLAFITGISDYVFLGIIIIFVRSALITFFLLKGLKKIHGYRESTRGVASELILDLAFFITASLILYYLVVSKYNSLLNANNSYDLVFSFALFFQGLFLILSRKSTVSQILGYIEEENSLVLFGIFLIPIPFLIEVSIFLDVLGLIIISSVLTRVKEEHKIIEELRG
ncbi:hydrogenase [Stygiolobus azoricus]|uniref:Hydrogenase n=1 Tax=Stygiolobus azoricus TaxID=41675 RepID=A0A650CLF1_9CREN|nr:hydrogenase [Stygiolobus azoricus]QGR18676.1 hydrogenase [Stygiolobus azoricus]